MGVISNGTTLLDAGALDSGVATGAMTLISTSTASSSATIDITSGIDSTYKEYVFKFINIHPANDDISFQFQADVGTGTSYAQTITSSHFRATHGEDASSEAVSYISGGDLAQETGFQLLAGSVGNDADQNIAGILHLFDPSSTTFVKHFVGNFQSIAHSNRSNNQYPVGYFNTTTAITRVRFKFASGNIDSGTIKMYGIK